MLRCQLPHFDHNLACLSLSHQFPLEAVGLQHLPRIWLRDHTCSFASNSEMVSSNSLPVILFMNKNVMVTLHFCSDQTLKKLSNADSNTPHRERQKVLNFRNIAFCCPLGMYMYLSCCILVLFLIAGCQWILIGHFLLLWVFCHAFSPAYVLPRGAITVPVKALMFVD